MQIENYLGKYTNSYYEKYIKYIDYISMQNVSFETSNENKFGLWEKKLKELRTRKNWEPEKIDIYIFTQTQK